MVFNLNNSRKNETSRVNRRDSLKDNIPGFFKTISYIFFLAIFLAGNASAGVTTKVQYGQSHLNESGERTDRNVPQSPSAVQDQIDLNIVLTGRIEDLARRKMLLTKKIEDITSQREEIDQEYALAKERVDNLSLTGALGLALREQKQLLPSENQYRRNSFERQRWMAEIQEYQIDLDRKQRDLSDIDAATAEILDSNDTLLSEEKKKTDAELRTVLLERQRLIEKLQSGYKEYFKSLRNLEFSEQQLISRSEEFEAFLDKHLLWIRSSEPIRFSDIGKLGKELKWISSLPNLKGLMADFQYSLQSRPVVWFMGLIITVFLLWIRKNTRRYWRDIAGRVGKPDTDSIVLTFQGFLLLLYESLIWAFILGFVSFQISGLPRSSVFTQSIANGLFSAAKLTFLVMFFSGFCRNRGLAQVHFQWAESARKTIRANMAWFAPLLVTFDFIIENMGASNISQYGNAMAKLGLFAQGIAMAFFCALIFRFSGGIASSMMARRPGSLLTRSRVFWYPLSIAIPLSNVWLVFYGYYYSAMELRNLISKTIVLLIGLVIIRDLALRGLRLTHRKYFKREKEKVATANLQKADESGNAATDTVIHREPEIDFAEINVQTRALLSMAIFILALLGIVAIWKEPARAFTIFQDIRLWAYNDSVNGIVTTVPVTLASLLVAALYAVITYIAARNLPGLLEMVLFSRLSMDAGSRYAFITLCRYAITALGVILVINAVGFNWSKIQWLIAALGVGLGFGLQEIVANFISGLIVLFERPFRIGDTITIGDTTGRVSRIKIRATTVVDWDRRELIVPNKEFITGKLINWSLSDPIIRIIVPVGIAYGSDTELAEKLLLKAAHKNSLVLAKPPPVAVFKGFGDSSLNFEIRVFINGIDDWIPMLHRLNLSVDKEFRNAGVTISFPQRDVHLDTSKPLEFRVVSSKSKKTSPADDA
jgi:potassium-dependent mechanosensitive channel